MPGPAAGTSAHDECLKLVFAAQLARRRWVRALRSSSCPGELLALDAAALRAAGLSCHDIRRLREAIPASWIDWLDHDAHHLVPYGSAFYPERLAQIDDPPIALWVEGHDLSLLDNIQLAMVGSRHPSLNGRRTAAAFAAELSDSGITVTSGLAQGIDAASHEGALTGPGRTIAVLGSGIDEIYPARNRKLSQTIVETGLVVSEYPPGTPVRRGQFPERNRVIAALSVGTLVVEAARQSGSLITARLAAEYGREVFAIPGSIHSALSKGCHKLILDGARLVETVCEILIELSPQLRSEDSEVETQAPERETLPAVLAEYLDFAPVTLDSLVSATGLTAAELSSMLLHLEIQGKIEALPGGRYCRLIKRS